MASPLTFGLTLYLAPAEWAVPPILLTWEELAQLTADLGLDKYAALPYTLLGPDTRLSRTAWYRRFTWYTQDGRTRYACDCLRVDAGRAIIDSRWRSTLSNPGEWLNDAAERRLLIATLSR